jgi:hypothetical protein
MRRMHFWGSHALLIPAGLHPDILLRSKSRPSSTYMQLLLFHRGTLGAESCWYSVQRSLVYVRTCCHHVACLTASRYTQQPLTDYWYCLTLIRSSCCSAPLPSSQGLPCSSSGKPLSGQARAEELQIVSAAYIDTTLCIWHTVRASYGCHTPGL